MSSNVPSRVRESCNEPQTTSNVSCESSSSRNDSQNGALSLIGQGGGTDELFFGSTPLKLALRLTYGCLPYVIWEWREDEKDKTRQPVFWS